AVYAHQVRLPTRGIAADAHGEIAARGVRNRSPLPLPHRAISLFNPPSAKVALGHGAWRSLVARFVRDEEVVGSNPATPTKRSRGTAEPVPRHSTSRTPTGRSPPTEGRANRTAAGADCWRRRAPRTATSPPRR